MHSQKIPALQQFFDVLSPQSKTEIIEGPGARNSYKLQKIGNYEKIQTAG